MKLICLKNKHLSDELVKIKTEINELKYHIKHVQRDQ